MQELNLNDREKTDFELIGTSDGHDAKYMMNRIEDKVRSVVSWWHVLKTWQLSCSVYAEDVIKW